MVEVLGGLALEATGPCRAPRTYPGPGELAALVASVALVDDADILLRLVGLPWSEPRKGSHVRTEAGERNVAERRHWRPCGEQSVDEVDGHRPQGKETSRFGLSCRRCIRGPGIGYHWKQRSNPQSYGHRSSSLSSQCRSRALLPSRPVAVGAQAYDETSFHRDKSVL
ncbi:hypothetical protein KPH14_007420 [Odynerus spinipes]|uniref:Uncharacterized protein n=1 Tax=Odynerus spinipes TaxID=1348599 RepID=A0AAD9RAV6_9HYME|nr:hypothetical protein KPH14_007420 [Odynerus spinipes]